MINKIRYTILDLFHHFPINYEPLRSVALDLITICNKICTDDNEDNAILAFKILFDLHKSYRPNLESYVQVYYNIHYTIAYTVLYTMHTQHTCVLHLYGNMPYTYHILLLRIILSYI